jgi:acyl-CoA synthetase (AMP-forming)/AMP-acid ligase II
LRRAGLQPGERVLLVFTTTRAAVESFWGILLAGGVPVPQAPLYSPRPLEVELFGERLLRCAEDCGARLCVAPGRQRVALRGALGSAPLTLLPAGAGGEVPLVGGELASPSAEETALIQYTSGSTAAPKGVELTHRSVLANLGAIYAGFLPLDPRELTISWLPLYHDMGLIGTLLEPIYSGTPGVLLPPTSFVKDPETFLRAASTHQATILVMPNFAFALCARRLESADLTGLRLDRVRTILNGAEPIDLELVERFERVLAPCGLRQDVVRPVYGLAESTLAVTFAVPGPCLRDAVDAERYERERVASPAAPGDRAQTFVSVGPPLPTQEVRIQGEDGPLPERQVGEVLVRGPSLMKGYYGQPELTAEALREGWLHTGDTGYLADGQLFITGRASDLIIRHGRNYHPQDIEQQVGRVEGVRKGCVVAFAIEEPADTALIVAAETREAGGEAHEELGRRIRARVSAAFALPLREVLLLPPGALPKSTSGKVRRLPCKEAYLAQSLGETPDAAAQRRAAARLVGRSALSFERELARRVRRGGEP